MREGETVTPLELFFDLVFVLAITQCTALMAAHPTWEGLAEGMLVLGLLWWAWVGYAWLTSVVDPEEGAVRLVIFASMAAFLVISLCIPHAFGDLGLLFAVSYGIVRVAQIVLFGLASRDEPNLRRSVVGLAVGTAIGVGLLVAASFLDNGPQLAVWFVALLLDAVGPYLFGSEGWKLVPGHFAERHGLIILIALGESIVAIGVGAQAGVDAGVVATAVVGTALAAGMWWAYFDVVALVASRRLGQAKVGREQNEMARDSYSYLHFPMLAGIILVALGLKKTIIHSGDPLHAVPAFALLGGLAFYLLGHVAFRYRHVRTINTQRLGLAVLLFACIPLSTAVHAPALATLSAVTLAMTAMLAYETRNYGDSRARLRHELGSVSANPT
jgi:low temperature requirement protein LtrA